ncbi:C40 family peptidase, partial [Enterobacter cloacae]|uniref:C40 family peptidase n=1 Tax=Enterobacter cloacae TaxID=550 RepID=UPI0028760EDF
MLDAIRQQVAAEYPKEACGLIVQSGQQQIYSPCRNIADQPEETFTLSPEDQLAARARGEIFMLIHSHPVVVRLVPSALDRIQCDWSGWGGGVMGWRVGVFGAWSGGAGRGVGGGPWGGGWWV